MNPQEEELKGKAELERLKEYLIGEKRSAATIESYLWKVKRMLIRLQKDPHEITQEDLNNYKIEMAKYYSANAMIPHTAAINVFFTYVIGKPQLKIKAPSKVEKSKEPFTVEEMEKMLARAKSNPFDYALLMVLYYGQLRKSEVVNLNVSDIDFVRGKLRVNKGKGNDYSTINLHPDALNAIRRYLQYRVRPRDGSDALFVSRNARRMDDNIIYARVKKYAAAAGIKRRVYPHLFRITSITHMAEAGATLPEIQKQSRHKDIKTLMGYVHIADKHAREVYLRTLPSFVPSENTVNKDKRDMLDAVYRSELTGKTKTEDTVVTVEEMEQKLLQRLCSGEITEETYLFALKALQKLKLHETHSKGDNTSYIR